MMSKFQASVIALQSLPPDNLCSRAFSKRRKSRIRPTALNALGTFKQKIIVFERPAIASLYLDGMPAAISTRDVSGLIRFLTTQLRTQGALFLFQVKGGMPEEAPLSGCQTLSRTG
jgi:hypothetical protein